jgi:hypothetical protein
MDQDECMIRNDRDEDDSHYESYYSSSGLQRYHNQAYYYDRKIKTVLFHLSVKEWIPILLLILYNEKKFWIQLPNQFRLHIINSGIIVKNNYFFQEEFFNIRVSFMLHIFSIQRLTELIHPFIWLC